MSTEGELYVRVPHLNVYWRGEQMSCFSPFSYRSYRLTPAVMKVLNAASLPIAKVELGRRCTVPLAFVERLIDLELLVDSTCASELERQSHFWSSAEMAVYAASNAGKRRDSLNFNLMPSMLLRHDGPTVGLDEYLNRELRPIPRFDDVLSQRRSERFYSEDPIELPVLARILVGAEGVQSCNLQRGTSHRGTASGGGRHPLEVYVVPKRVSTLSGRLYHFNPFERLLVELKWVDMEESWAASATWSGLDSGSDAGPAAVIVITAVWNRTLWKYRDIGLATVYKDLGALLQNLYLCAVASGCSGCAVGGGPHTSVLGSYPLRIGTESYVGAFALGYAREQA